MGRQPALRSGRCHCPGKTCLGEGAFENNLKNLLCTYTFNYEYADFPQEVFLYLVGNFKEKQSFGTLTWTTPDGREFKLKSTSVEPELTYTFENGLNARNLVNQNKNWQ